MMRSGTGLFIGAVCLLSAAQANAQPAIVDVDLRDARRGIMHSDLKIPAKPGPMTLVYPRWIPGDHLPAGPIGNLTGLTVKFDGKPIAWRRDRYDMDAFHIVVPDGADHVQVHFDFLASPTLDVAINPASSATTDNLLILRWHVVTLYPQDADPKTYMVKPTIRLPDDWRPRTAMTGVSGADGAFMFEDTTLERLIDSPLAAGTHQKTIALSPNTTKVPHRITITVDDPNDLAMTAGQIDHLTAMLDQARAMLGPEPFPHYDFLVTISSKLRASVGIGGQEHHESSDNVGRPGLFAVPEAKSRLGELLSHEYAHSWSGKFRRPIGEVRLNYQQPVDNSLLWVYEGLTAYIDKLLAVRSGFSTEPQFRDQLADAIGRMANRQGREWRSLSDTGVGLGSMMHATLANWNNWRRGTDYYLEGSLLWMDVDAEIRSLSKGKRSLDDFCRLFFVKAPGDPLVKPYDLDEVVQALNSVVPADWRAFLDRRLFSLNSMMPEQLPSRLGYKLVYTGYPSDFSAISEEDGSVDATYSIGVLVSPDGTIRDLRFNTPADMAGLAPGMKIISVGGLQFRGDSLRSAIDKGGTLALIVANDGNLRPIQILYSGGQRYPTLERGSGPDLIKEMIRPIAPAGKK
ncbi:MULTISPECIES: M61 family metallopeptidase [unclassified Sphingobium]|nr:MULTISPECIES: M61 family metallopeptidase [unclassified Sphingobium]PSO09680.1 hypothetical protein C7E20_21265 [Sphingobium sp. AEW4]